MDNFIPMNDADRAKTKAYLAYISPTAEINASKQLMNMMWHSEKAMQKNIFAPRLNFAQPLLENEIKCNPELYASLTCAVEIMQRTGEDHVMPEQVFTTKKGGTAAFSAVSYAKKIGEEYPQLGNFYMTRLEIVKQENEKRLEEIIDSLYQERDVDDLYRHNFSTMSTMTKTGYPLSEPLAHENSAVIKNRYSKYKPNQMKLLTMLTGQKPKYPVEIENARKKNKGNSSTPFQG